MPRAPRALAALLMTLAVGCGDPPPGTLSLSVATDVIVDPGAELPPISIRLIAGDGGLDLDHTLTLTLTHDGRGELVGDTEVVLSGGVAQVTGLRYEGCDTIRIRATADDPRVEPVVSSPLRVTPELELVGGPTQTVIDGSGAIGPMSVRLVGQDGTSLALDGVPLTVEIDGGVTFEGGSVTEAATMGGGLATFDPLEVGGAGLGTVTVHSGDPMCSITPLTVGRVAVGAVVDRAALTLPSGRVGVPYSARFGDGSGFLAEDLPPGLAIGDGATLEGIPTSFGWHESLAFRVLTDGTVERTPLGLAIFPNHDPELPEPFDPSGRGAYPVDVAALTLPSVETSLGALANVAVRVAYPSDGAGALADGRFPLVVFLPTVSDPPVLYDRYAELHDHWASHGFVVASVDTSALALEPLDPVALDDHRRMLLAAADRLRAESADTASPFFERVDGGQVWAAGHGRGGSGALLAARDDPQITGVIAIAPISPQLVEALETGEPPVEPEEPGHLPALIFVAGDDRVVPWPEADLAAAAFDGASATVTILGANHLDSVDEGTPNLPVSPSAIARAERHAVERRYSTAFLHRFARGELGFEASLFGRRGQQTDLSSRGVVVRSRRDTNTALDFPLRASFGRSSFLPEDEVSPYDAALTSLGVGLPALVSRLPRLSEATELAWEMSFPVLTATFDGFVAPELIASRRRLVFDVLRACPAPPDDPMTPDDLCPHIDTTFVVGLEDISRDGTGLDVATELGEARIRGRHWTTVILELNDFDLDPGRLSRMTLEFSAAMNGDLWFGAFRFE